jgi:hypothetical protein
MSATYRD